MKGLDDRATKDATKGIVTLLVAGDYAGVERRTNGVRLSAEEISRAVKEYGRKLRMPPDETFEALSVGEIRDSNPKAWWVVCNLWTEEEGKSDLSLELTLIDDGGHLRVELDNLHVL